MSSLKVIPNTNILDIVEYLNYNFNLIQNSPLYKGIPGAQGEQGTVGPEGIRGARFIFVKEVVFKVTFPNNDINPTFLENLLNTDYNTAKLLLDVSEVVDGDLFVFDNTTEIWENNITPTFENHLINTGVSFNVQSNILNTIRRELNAEISRTLQNIMSTYSTLSFTAFDTISRNFGYNENPIDNLFDPNTSIYFPVIPGLIDASSGTDLTTENSTVDDNYKHKFIGILPTTSTVKNQTTVIGAMKSYVNKLQRSQAGSNVNTNLSTDYAPDYTKLPGLVVLQNNNKSGILIGNDSDSDLKKFASIYKTSTDLIFESEYGPDQTQKGILSIGKALMQFNNSLKIGKNFTLIGDIKSQFINSGDFASNKLPTDSDYFVEIGEGSIVNILAKKLRFGSKTENTFVKKVLVTDDKKELSSDYVIDPVNRDQDFLTNLDINTAQNPIDKRFATSGMLSYLAKLLLGVNDFNDLDLGTVNLSNVWYKSDFLNFQIPEITLSKRLAVSLNQFNSPIFDIRFEKVAGVDVPKIDIGSSSSFIKMEWNELEMVNVQPLSVITTALNGTKTIVSTQFKINDWTNNSTSLIWSVNNSAWNSDSTDVLDNIFASMGGSTGTSDTYTGDELSDNVKTSWKDRILTGGHFKIMINLFKSLKSYINGSYSDVATPPGSIITYAPLSGDFIGGNRGASDSYFIPRGWVPCSGGKAYNADGKFLDIPNLVDRFALGAKPVLYEDALYPIDGNGMIKADLSNAGLRDMKGNNYAFIPDECIPPHNHKHIHTISDPIAFNLTGSDGKYKGLDRLLHVYTDWRDPLAGITTQSIEYNGTSYYDELTGVSTTNIPGGAIGQGRSKTLFGSMASYIKDYINKSLQQNTDLTFTAQEKQWAYPWNQTEPGNMKAGARLPDGNVSGIVRRYNLNQPDLFGGSLIGNLIGQNRMYMVSRHIKTLYLYKLPYNFKLTKYVSDITEYDNYTYNQPNNITPDLENLASAVDTPFAG